MAFVAYVPPADSAGPYPVPARLRLTQQRPPWPTGPLLRKGYVVPSLHAIRPDPPVSTAPPDFPRTLVIQEALPDDSVWAAIETFPALGQCSFHTCRHLYAGRRSRSISPMSPCSRRLPHQTSESAPPQSRPRLLSGGISTLPPVFALLRPAQLLALLDRSDPERTSLSGRRGLFSYPSFPAEGHPPRESDIATRRPGADTVTGLSPVGALPLQAARSGEGQVVEAIRRRSPTTPIVLITGLVGPEVMRRCGELGLPVVAKPFRSEVLRVAVATAIQANPSSQSSFSSQS